MCETVILLEDDLDDGGNPAALALARAAAARSRHWTMLWIASAVLVASLVLEVRYDQRVVLPWPHDCPLPESCASRAWFGIECPGCGLTRSFIHLAHGRWRESVAIHRVGWILALGILAQFPYRIVALAGKIRRPLGEWCSSVFGIVLIFLLVGNWLFNLVLRYFV